MNRVAGKPRISGRVMRYQFTRWANDGWSNSEARTPGGPPERLRQIRERAALDPKFCSLPAAWRPTARRAADRVRPVARWISACDDGARGDGG